MVKDIIQARCISLPWVYMKPKVMVIGIGDSIMPPGWRAIHPACATRSYDVPRRFMWGESNGVTLGDGWYRGRLGFGVAYATPMEIAWPCWHSSKCTM
jgi:alpha-L-rhamnosidase